MEIGPDKFTRHPYIFGGFKFVASEHPYFDSSSLQIINGLRNIVLQLVFDSSGSQQCESPFKPVKNRGHVLVSVFQH
jgi:hypothetical protein